MCGRGGGGERGGGKYFIGSCFGIFWFLAERIFLERMWGEGILTKERGGRPQNLWTGGRPEKINNYQFFFLIKEFKEFF